MNPKRATVIFLLLGAAPVSVASAVVPDSLKHRIDSLMVVSTVATNLQKYEADFKIAWDLFDIDNVVALKHAGLAYKIATDEGDSLKVVHSGRLYAQLLRRSGDLDEAEAVFVKILPLAAGIDSNRLRGRILNSLAVLNTFRGKYDQALVSNLKALRIWQAELDSVRIADTHLNIGFNYYKMSNFREAIFHFKRATFGGDSTIRSSATMNRGFAQLHLNEFESFPDLARQAHRLAPPLLRETSRIQLEAGFGTYFLRQGIIDSASKRLGNALARSERMGDVRMIMEMKDMLVECALKAGRADDAIAILKGLEELTGLGYDDIRLNTYERSAIAYEMKADWRRALTYRLKQISLQDSAFAQTVQNNIAIARIEFEEKENEEMIAKQEEIIGLKNSMIDRQRWLIVGATLLILVSTGFIILLRRFNSYQKWVAQELDRKVCERTKELQVIEQSLLRCLGEQQSIINLVTRKVNVSVARFRGLWDIGATDGNPVDGGVKLHFETTANELLQFTAFVDTRWGYCSPFSEYARYRPGAERSASSFTSSIQYEMFSG